MKNKNFTSELNTVISNAFVVLLFLLTFVSVQQLNGQTADCPLACNDMIQVSVDNECVAIITPQMIIEGEKDSTSNSCGYEILTIVNEDGIEVGHAGSDGNWILNGEDVPDYTYQSLMATVSFQADHSNSCMGGLRLEDKISPTLRCLDTVYVSCSETLDDYLDTDTDATYSKTTTTFPVSILAGNTLDVDIDVDNIANQSEVVNFIQALISSTNNSGLRVVIEDPDGITTPSLTYPFVFEVGDDGLFIQATDDHNGIWKLHITNTTTNNITLLDAKFRVKSTGFLRIGNGLIVNDNCHLDEAKIVILSDITTNLEDACNKDYFRKREIKYQGIDWRGMKSPICTHVIFWKHNTLDDLKWPHNWDGIDENPLSCTGKFMEKSTSGELTDSNKSWDLNGDGYPQPEEIDVPTIDGKPIYPDPVACMINVTYKDEVMDICPGSFKILRKWIAYDMCEAGDDDCCGGNGNPRTHYQLIKVIDNTPITFETNDVGYIEVSANPYDCSACATLPVPKIQNYGCSEGYTYEVGYCTTNNGIFEYFENISSNVVNGETVYTICDLPVGTTCVRYIVTDLCGNKSYGTLEVRVIDDIPPVPVCDEHTVATVTTDCTARVNAETFDDGSFDNCSDVHFQVARMYGSSVGTFGDYVDFNSNDVGKTSQVVLKVIDEEGNWNTCMVEVYVDDKIPPTIKCPKNVTIDCTQDPHDVSITGGEADYWDNCGATLTHTDYGSLNNCNVGSIRRHWEVVDNSGKKASCNQYIYVKNLHPFTMLSRYWPRDVNNLIGCSNNATDPSNTGEPDWGDDGTCAMVSSTYTDRVFNVVSGACYKILRDWIVMDMCQYDPHNPIPTNNPSNPYVGYWVHTQVIIVSDYNAPVFTTSCDDQTICAYNADCTGDVTITAEADDECTPQDELVWQYEVTGANLAYPIRGNTNTFKRTHMALGTYTIHWTVEDKCGNFTECTYNFTVKDCKNPTPLCYSEITTVLMPSTTPKMVSVIARDFDRGSTDNCDEGSSCGHCSTDLRFSFSGTNPYDSVRTFVDGQEGLHTLDMWVWDRAGNRDYCTVTIYIQDNAQGLHYMVGGTVTTEDSKKVNKVNVTVSERDGFESKSVLTSDEGIFRVSVQGNKNYDLTASYNDSYMNGISTLDLVLIQKHILGVKKFNTPYKVLAADINKDHHISSSDILALRKLILGIDNKFKNNSSWVMVNGKFTFDNIENPWDNENNENMFKIGIDNISGDVLDNKFVAIKIGDVNNSAIVNGTPAGLGYRSFVELTIDNKSFAKDEYVEVPVYATNNESFAGMQLTLDLGDKLQLQDITSGTFDINKSNYAVKANKVYFSWNAMDEVNVKKDEILFTLRLKANGTGQLIDQLHLTNDLRAEAYNENLDVEGLELTFRGAEEQSFVLFQNTPNPFSASTEIAFKLPYDAYVTISIFDVTGKVIYKTGKDFEMGYNSVKVSKDDLNHANGILYYKVEYDGNVAVKKMILLDK